MFLVFSCRNQIYEKGQAALSQNPTVDWDNTFRSLDHQYQNIDVTKYPEKMKDPEWQVGTFLNDLLGIDRADIVCGMFLPQKPDSGMAFEYGYAYMLTIKLLFKLFPMMWLLPKLI